MPKESSFSQDYLDEVIEVAKAVDANQLDRIAKGLKEVKEDGARLFILGVGGGAGHASHAVNDFRKICSIESYCPTDNVSELTARTNDDGWDTSFIEWLKMSKLGSKDAILVFSVGGGSKQHNISMNIVNAVEYAKEVGAKVFGIVGKPDGTTAKLADECVVVKAPQERLTPHVEGYQAVLWHLLVTHPEVASKSGTWESIEKSDLAEV